MNKKIQKDWIKYLENGHYREVTSFLKFAVLWLVFVGLLKDDYRTKENTECDSRKRFILENKEKYRELIKKDKKFEMLIRSFRDTKTPLRESVLDMEGSRSPVYFTDLEFEDFGKYITVLHRIRCNFFHGDKSMHPTDYKTNDDRKLVEWAFDSFLYFWKYFLKEKYGVKF